MNIKRKYFGNAGHFICADKCQFHITTQIGTYLVSTVGELWPGRAVREIIAKSHDPAWLTKNQSLKGDAFDAAYMERFGYDTIGHDRKFETMVFKTSALCKCGCGMPEIIPSELDFAGYNDRASANSGHEAMCVKWEKKLARRTQSRNAAVLSDTTGNTPE
jgi:hypothetical protein